MEPMLLRPAGKDYLWGGNRLKTEYGKDLDMEPLAETWECSTHSDGLSTVASGIFKGKTLAEVIKEHPEFLGTKHRGKRELPILVKLIDAEKDLSVQVHPDDGYALEHEGQLGKTEMWYILDAKPGAEIIYGFEHQVSPQQLRESAEAGVIAKHLHHVAVAKGDVFYISPGTVHAIGAGILLAEIQQSSNVTYRIYDYDRTDRFGKKRQLHYEQAFQVMDSRARKEILYRGRNIHYEKGYSRELLCRCPFFQAEKIHVNERYPFMTDETSFQVLLCLEGEGVLRFSAKEPELLLEKGACVFLPVDKVKYEITGQIEVMGIKG